MPRGSLKLTLQRREEIINACASLYESTSFKDITIQKIGNLTSFTRTSIYNYFETKEEIFLALLMREHELWIEDLEAILAHERGLSLEDFASLLAASLEKRTCMLKILSVNLYDIEDKSRMEHLVAFKKIYHKSMQTLDECLIKFFPSMKANERQEFLFIFYPFMFGVYPYTVVNPKQKEAMDKAQVTYAPFSIEKITTSLVIKLLKDFVS